MRTVFVSWDLPGDVLAAPESALGLDRCHPSLSLSLSQSLLSLLLSLVYLEFQSQPWSKCLLGYLSLSLLC